MANALSQGLSTPPAPNPQPDDQNSAQTGAPLSGVPSASAGSQAAPQQPPAQPAPTHAQTVAAMRHFDAIKAELKKVLANPDCGKTDMRSQIIDGNTRLVAEGIFRPTDAIGVLASVPDKPFDQKKWLEQHLMQSEQAEEAIFDQHVQAFGGNPGAPGAQPGDPDASHPDTMVGLMNHYQGLRPSNA